MDRAGVRNFQGTVDRAAVAAGNVRTTTMRAFNAEEMREIIAKATG